MLGKLKSSASAVGHQTVSALKGSPQESRSSEKEQPPHYYSATGDADQYVPEDVADKKKPRQVQEAQEEEPLMKKPDNTHNKHGWLAEDATTIQKEDKKESEPVYSSSGQKGTYLPEPGIEEKAKILKGCLFVYRIYLCIQGFYGVIAGAIIITIASLGLLNDEVAVYLGPNYVFSPKARTLLSWAVFLGVAVIFYNSCFLCIVIWKMNKTWLKRQGIFKVLIALGVIIWMVMVFVIPTEKEVLQRDWEHTLRGEDWDKLCLVQDIYNCSGWSNATIDDVPALNCSGTKHGFKPDAHVPLPPRIEDNSLGFSADASSSSEEAAIRQELADQAALEGCSAVRFGGLIIVAFYLALLLVIFTILDLPLLISIIIQMAIMHVLEKQMQEAALLEKEQQEKEHRDFQLNQMRNKNKVTHV